MVMAGDGGCRASAPGRVGRGWARMGAGGRVGVRAPTLRVRAPTLKRSLRVRAPTLRVRAPTLNHSKSTVCLQLCNINVFSSGIVYLRKGQ